MRILLLGKNGQVGRELEQTLAPLGTVTALDYPEVDFVDLDRLRALVRKLAPQLIINAAAYTAVDQAENEPERALAINATAPGVLAQEASRLGSALIHYSTDYVFDGTKHEPYTEQDVPRPVNVYGETKLAGDRAVQAVGGAYLILRTSWVYGSRGHNFFLTIRKLARERQVLQVVDDQVGSPTWSRFLGEATARILNLINGGQAGSLAPGVAARQGIYNLSSLGQTSWCGFARRILETDPLGGETTVKQVAPISSEEYPSRAKRPLFSVLSNQKVRSVFGIEIPSWEQQLDACWKTLVE